MDSVRKRKKLLLLLRQYQDAEDVEQYLYLKSPKEREFHVRQIYKERNSKGEFHLLVKEARLMDHELFFEMFRMTPTKYEELLAYVGPHILKDSTRREVISPDERLSVTLRYLVTVDAFGTIGKSYRIDGGLMFLTMRINGTSLIVLELLMESMLTFNAPPPHMED